MNIGAIFVSAILSYFPRLCDLQKTEESSNNSIFSRIVYPTDRRKLPSLRIIGGMDAIPNSYPFQAAIDVYIKKNGKDMVSSCGGTLITPEWVLTAAHCFGRDNVSYAKIWLGVHDVYSNEPNKIELISDSFVLHEDWSTSNHQNDIAMVHLPTNVTLTPYIQTVNYDTDDDKSYEGEIGTVIGWGVTAFGGGGSATLKQVNESVISNKKCAELLRDEDVRIVSSHLCTSGGGTEGSCEGDSGGPLLNNGLQIGIVSFGLDECKPPTVYTRVSHFSDWIYRTTHGLPTGARHASDSCCIFTSLRCMVVTSTIVYLLMYFT